MAWRERHLDPHQLSGCWSQLRDAGIRRADGLHQRLLITRPDCGTIQKLPSSGTSFPPRGSVQDDSWPDALCEGDAPRQDIAHHFLAALFELEPFHILWPEQHQAQTSGH